MKHAVTGGLRNSILFYVLSIALTLIVHAIVGWESRSLYPKSAIVMIFVFLVAIPWAILNISNLICPIKRSRNASELISHMVFLSFISAVLNFIH